MRNAPGVSFALTLLVTILPAFPSSAAVVITFEELTPLEGIPVAVGEQYSKSLGITFNGPTAIDYATRYNPLPGFAHSPTKGIEPCYATEFCHESVGMKFTEGQRRVKVWVGYSKALPFGRTVALTAFDAGGSVVARTEITLPPSVTPTSVRYPLEVLSTSPNIESATVGFSAPGSGNQYLAVDDVEFDTAGPPPSCVASDPPTLLLTEPVLPLTVSLNEFTLVGTILMNGAETVSGAACQVLGPSSGQVSTLDLLTLDPAIRKGGSFRINRLTGFLFPGKNTIRVTVETCGGSAGATGTVAHEPIGDAASVVLMGLEVSQALADRNPEVLIAGKRTSVRVYLRLQGSSATLRNVRGTLSACRELVAASSVCGAPLTVSPRSTSTRLQSRNAITLTASEDLPAREASPDGGLEFELPPEWVVAGRLHVEVSSLSIGGSPLSLSCSGCDVPNPRLLFRPRFYTFESGPVLSLQLIKIKWHPTSVIGPEFETRQADIDHLKSWLGRAYPVSRVRAHIGSLSRFGPGAPSASKVNLWLAGKRLWENVFSIYPGPYYGLIDDGGDVPGHKLVRGASAVSLGVASGPSGDPRKAGFLWDTDASYADWYGGHMIGHLLFRLHPGFTMVGGRCERGEQGEGFTDLAYPHPRGSIGVWGVDAGDSGLGIPPQRYDPAQWTDVMTDCDSRWISDYTYDGLQSYLEELLRDDGARSAADATPPDQEGVMVLGTIDTTSGAVELQPFSRVPRIPPGPQSPGASNFTIDLLDSGGALLARHPFQPSNGNEGASPAGETPAVFAEVIPFPPRTARIGIFKEGVAIASRRVSAHSPAVRVVSPNGGTPLTGSTVEVTWEAMDADGDPLAYTVLFSNDQGQTWQTLAFLLDEPRVTIPLADLPGGAQSLFRVIATDGVNIGMDDSDAPFAVANQAPRVRILSPADGARFSRADTVVFTADASDAEEEDPDGAQLQWSSDRQGLLGEGSSLASTELLAGQHTITLSGRDAAGASATASVRLLIDPVIPVADAEADPAFAAVGDFVHLSGRRSSGSPPLRFEWLLVSRPAGSGATLLNAAAIETDIVVDAAGEYVLQLVVGDEAGAIAVDRVVIVAGPAPPPPAPGATVGIPLASPAGLFALLAILVALSIVMLHRK